MFGESYQLLHSGRTLSVSPRSVIYHPMIDTYIWCWHGVILLNSAQHPVLTPEQRVRMRLCCWLVCTISIGEICDIDSACRVLEILMGKGWKCCIVTFRRHKNVIVWAEQHRKVLGDSIYNQFRETYLTYYHKEQNICTIENRQLCRRGVVNKKQKDYHTIFLRLQIQDSLMTFWCDGLHQAHFTKHKKRP